MIPVALFGNTGLRLSRLCLGTMTFGTAWGFGVDQATSQRVLDAYLDSGGNFIDTANKYTDGESESILGAHLRNKRNKVVIATKYALNTDSDDPNSLGNHRRNLVTSIEGSLRRLNTDFIDFLWIHAWYFETPIEDTVRALDDMITAGKILYWGMSDTPAWVCAEARTIANLRGWAPLSGIQIEYSLIERTAERELLPFAANTSTGVTGAIPLGGGLLTGKHHSGAQKPDSLRIQRSNARKSASNDDIVRVVTRLAKDTECTPSQLALAWILETQPIIPIIGARTEDQLLENLKAVSLKVEPEVIHELDEVSKINPGFPHEMLAGERMQQVMYGPFKK